MKTELQKYREFDALCLTVGACRNCPRMAESARVLNRGAGSIDAPIMFVGEAPGRLGADSSELAFHGDKAGHNFEELLSSAGLTRASTFVTNAVLCNPKDDKGNNSPPNKSEIENCAGHLKNQIDILDPRIVVTLGAVSLKSTALVESHSLTLSSAVRSANRWYGRILIPLYHPGQRAMIHRSFANQRSDYQFVAEQLKHLGVSRKIAYGGTKADIAAVAEVIINTQAEISYFALHKLFYLVELAHVKKHGARLTSAFFIRQKDGPYCVDLHLQKLRRTLSGVTFKNKSGHLFLQPLQADLFGSSKAPAYSMNKEIVEEILGVISKYGDLGDSELKTKVYLSTPMRRILRQEATGSNLFNSPIEFSQ